MDHFLTEEQREISDLARRIAEQKILPIRAEYDETGEFPWEIVKILGQSDLMGVYIPEEYGGMGGGVMEMVIVTEELSRICGGVALAFAATGLGAFPILLYGTEAQKRKYLADIASGKKLAAFGLTEAESGSDAASIKSTAVREGDYYVLNGTKQWITNGGGSGDLHQRSHDRQEKRRPGSHRLHHREGHRGVLLRKEGE